MKELSRRAFVRGGLGLAAGTLPFARVEGAIAVVQRATGRTPLTRSTFAPLVGTKIEMLDGNRSTMVRLVAVGDLQPARMPNDDHCFSLLFQAATGGGAGQRIYRFRSANLGTLSLFAVPSGEGGYRVVVNNPV